MVTQNYTISTVKNAVPPKVKMSQYDSASRTITFTVVDASGSEVSLTGKAVTVEGTRIDGHAFASECTVSEATATFIETVDMTNQAGDHPAELVIRENGERLGTMNFIVSVEPAAMDEDAEVTEEDKSLFEQLYGVGDAALSAAETLYQHILDNASAPIIYNTASGAVASFSDGSDDYPIKGLTVEVEPVQSGSDDPSPSNVRPISGWNEVKVTRTGRNLINTTASSATNSGITCTRNDDGSYSVTGTATSANINAWLAGGYGVSSPQLLFLKQGTVVTITDCMLAYHVVGSSTPQTVGAQVKLNNTHSQTFTVQDDIIVHGVRCPSATNGTTYDTTIRPQLEIGSTATDYEPYQGNEYTISLGETVYGGTLDVVGGKMVVDRAMIDLSSSDWTGSTLSTGVMRGTLPDNVLIPSSLGTPTTAIMDRRIAKDYNKISQSDTGYFAIRSNKTIIIPMGRAITVEEFIAEYGDAQLCYPIETPIEIPLTPPQINTLLGVNNVYSDAGDVEVEYPADTKRFILNSIASALA